MFQMNSSTIRLTNALYWQMWMTSKQSPRHISGRAARIGCTRIHFLKNTTTKGFVLEKPLITKHTHLEAGYILTRLTSDQTTATLLILHLQRPAELGAQKRQWTYSLLPFPQHWKSPNHWQCLTSKYGTCTQPELPLLGSKG